MKLSGVYFIKNINTGKVYVGSSVDIYRRWNTHRRELKTNSHHCVKLQNSFAKHGEEAFEYCLAESSNCLKQIAVLEEKWIQIFDAVDNGYNINPFPYQIGLLHKSEEHKKKIGAAHKGRKLSDESKDKIRQKALGRKRGPMSDEQKKKLSEIKKGWKMPEEGKQKLSEYRKSLKGTIVVSEEAKKNMSLAKLRFLS